MCLVHCFVCCQQWQKVFLVLGIYSFGKGVNTDKVRTWLEICYWCVEVQYFEREHVQMEPNNPRRGPNCHWIMEFEDILASRIAPPKIIFPSQITNHVKNNQEDAEVSSFEAFAWTTGLGQKRQWRGAQVLDLRACESGNHTWLGIFSTYPQRCWNNANIEEEESE